MESLSENSRSANVLSQDRLIDPQMLKEELKCRICLGIVRKPKECKSCENSFCSDCLEEWFKSS